MLSYRDFSRAFQGLGLTSESQVLVHASLPALGEITGGAKTIVGSLVASVHTIITPTFTTNTMITPPYGPDDNALQYDAPMDVESIGVPFTLDLPADKACGEFAEIIRLHPEARRSNHPLLSFAGVNAEELLSDQTLENPWAPIRYLADEDGDILLIGADHTANVAIHYAESLAGRKQFTRWAMWNGKVVEVPQWPGCSKGFQSIASKLDGVIREVQLGRAVLYAIPLRDLINIAKGWIQEDPEALLCQDPDCAYCKTVRKSIEVS
jgi:aminoglycoside 3-N-acetyltransferase